MKTREKTDKWWLPRGVFGSVRFVSLGIMVSLLLSGCSTDKAAAPIFTSRPAPAVAALAPGAVAVTSPTAAALFGFDTPQGRIESAGEGAADAARAVMNTPWLSQSLGGPYIQEALGVLEFAASPFVAGYGALRAAHRVLPADQLAEREADLVQAMRAMAEQTNLAQFVAQSAREQEGWRVAPLASMSRAAPEPSRISAILDTRVEHLQLARLGKSDSSYVLRLKVRARLLRGSDWVVLCDRAYEYQSGCGMFIDWARWGGFESVAKTGYRSLGAQIAADLLPSATDQPVMLGAGYRGGRAGASDARFARVQNSRPDVSDRVQPIAMFASVNGTVEVYAKQPLPDLFLQLPLTKQEAVEDAVDQNGWDLDGMQDDRNSVVQVLAQVAAVPPGLWKQVVGIVQGRSARKVRTEEAELRTAARRGKPGLVLAHEVAQSLAAQSAGTVLLAVEPLPLGEDATSRRVLYSVAKSGSEPVQRVGQTVPRTLRGTALEIQVTKAALRGKSGINPPMALCFEAKATLYLTDNGQELYSCPVFYRSQERRFKEWAAANAQLFRQELDRDYAEMGNAVVRQLVVRGMVAPAGRSGSTLAKD